MNHRPTEKTHGHDGSVTLSEISRREQTWADEQPMTVRCGLCGWSNTGPAARARATAARHRLNKHPELAGQKKRTGSDATIAAANAARAQREDDERVAKAERSKRRDALELVETAGAGSDPAEDGDAASSPLPAAPAVSTSSYVPRPGSRPAQVLALLEGGPLRSAAMCARLVCGSGQLGFTLNDLVKRGLVVRVKKGLYGLPGAAACEEREPAAGESGAVIGAPGSVAAAPTGNQTSRSSDTARLLRALIDRHRKFLDEVEAVLEEAA